MKIKKEEFWELIKSGKKTIELRKVSKLEKLNLTFDNKGRFKINLVKNKECEENKPFICVKYLKDCKNYLGTITINGYEIIKNPWFGKYEYYKNNYRNFQSSFVKEDTYAWIRSNFCHLGNEKWIYDNWDWLIDYFKDEPEILVLKIESWEK